MDPETDRINALKAAGELFSKTPLILDTETTGIDESARIVDIAIMAPNGRVAFESFVNPEVPIPVEASRIHGITDKMVEGAPTWPEICGRIRDLLYYTPVAGYNIGFDLRMVEQMDLAYGLSPVTFEGGFSGDVMSIYAQYYGEWDDYHGNYRWQKLTTACKQLGIEFEQEAAHRARYDCELARQVMFALNERWNAYWHIDEVVKNLAYWRKTEQEAKKHLEEIQAEMEARWDWKSWDDQLDRARSLVATHLDEIRRSALEANDKHPHPAVGIRNITRLEYDPRKAYLWCQDHLPAALVLDRTFFEKHAKAVAKTSPLDFVTISQEPQATIATDLSAYLDKVAPVDEAPAVEPGDIPF
jgi:DNA polymerase-3 subunit epsilon